MRQRLAVTIEIADAGELRQRERGAVDPAGEEADVIVATIAFGMALRTPAAK